MRHWVARGVRVFRVDNPHTKPLAFWEWLIAEVRAEDPEVVFLSEAFTRLPMMRALGKLGFSQSYTYFTWKNGAWELREYVDELLGRCATSCAPTCSSTPRTSSPSTSSTAGRRPSTRGWCSPRRSARATGSTPASSTTSTRRCARAARSTWTPRSTRSARAALDGPLLGTVRRLNVLRREHPALQRLEGVWFLATENDALLAYAKRAPGDIVLVVVNVDPAGGQEGVCVIPHELGLPPAFHVRDALDRRRVRLARRPQLRRPGARRRRTS